MMKHIKVISISLLSIFIYSTATPVIAEDREILHPFTTTLKNGDLIELAKDRSIYETIKEENAFIYKDTYKLILNGDKELWNIALLDDSRVDGWNVTVEIIKLVKFDDGVSQDCCPLN